MSVLRLLALMVQLVPSQKLQNMLVLALAGIRAYDVKQILMIAAVIHAVMPGRVLTGSTVTRANVLLVTRGFYVIKVLFK